MFRGIFCVAVMHTSIASDSCVESDGISVLQKSLADRSGQQVSQQVVQSNVEQAIASKGGRDGHLENSAQGKSSPTIAQLEEGVVMLESKVATAKTAFSSASNALFLQVYGSSVFEGDSQLLEAFKKAEEELLTREASMARECDDLALKLGDELQKADEKAPSEREDILVKIETYNGKSKILYANINTRMTGLADEFHRMRGALWSTDIGPLEPILNALAGQFVTAVADVEEQLQKDSTGTTAEAEVALQAANDVQGGVIRGLLGLLDGLGQLKRLAELVLNILEKTNEKLWKLKSSALRRNIQAEEVDLFLRVQAEFDDWGGQLQTEEVGINFFLREQADKFDKWSGQLQTEFNRQFGLSLQFMADLTGKLDQTILASVSAFRTDVRYGQDLKASASEEIKSKYFADFSHNHAALSSLLFQAATDRRDFVIAQTSAAQSIAQCKVDELDGQRTAAVKSTSVTVVNMATTIQSQIHQARVELISAEEKAQTALVDQDQRRDDFSEYTQLVGAEDDELSTQVVNFVLESFGVDVSHQGLP